MGVHAHIVFAEFFFSVWAVGSCWLRTSPNSICTFHGSCLFEAGDPLFVQNALAFASLDRARASAFAAVLQLQGSSNRQQCQVAKWFQKRSIDIYWPKPYCILVSIPLAGWRHCPPQDFSGHCNHTVCLAAVEPTEDKPFLIFDCVGISQNTPLVSFCLDFGMRLPGHPDKRNWWISSWTTASGMTWPAMLSWKHCGIPRPSYNRGKNSIEFPRHWCPVLNFLRRPPALLYQTSV